MKKLLKESNTEFWYWAEPEHSEAGTRALGPQGDLELFSSLWSVSPRCSLTKGARLQESNDIALQLVIEKDDGKAEFPRVSVKFQVAGVRVHEYCLGRVTKGVALKTKAFHLYGLTTVTTIAG